jgi:dihydroneopterin aldolase
MDSIILEGIEFYAYGGVSEAERTIGQRYRARVQLWTDLSTAARTDSLADTVNYARVYETVVQTARERRFNLIESVAARAAARLLESFPVEQVTVRLQKLAPPIDGVVEYAAVEITRRREPSS